MLSQSFSLSLICLRRLKLSLGRRVNFAILGLGRLVMENQNKNADYSFLLSWTNGVTGSKRPEIFLIFQPQKTLVGKKSNPS
jgi:hypothetical protein